MIKSAIEKILEISEPHIALINGENYSDKRLTRVSKDLRAESITIHTLSGLVDFIKNSGDVDKKNYIVQVVSPTEVRFFSGLDADREREELVVAKAELPTFTFDRQINSEEFLINVQAKFVDAPGTDKAAILRFAGTVKAGSVREYSDNGVSQTATVKRGVATLTEEVVPNPCKLAPYRTFLEVEQPISEFVFRMGGDEKSVTCGLYEADGGRWKIKARQNVAEYLRNELASLKNILVLA